MDSKTKKVLIIIILFVIAVAGSYYIRLRLKIFEPGSLGSRESPNFTVYFNEIDSKAADDVIKAGEENYSRITRDMGYDPSRKIEIIIYPSRKDFRKAVGLKIPPWIVSATINGRIMIQSPFTYLKLTNCSYNDIFKIVPHEFTHLVLWEIVTDRGKKDSKQSIPAWFIEGLAYHEADQITDYDLEKLKNDYNKGRLFPIKDLQTLPGDQSKAEEFYKQSGWLVRYMSQNYGQDKIQLMIRNLASENSFNDSLIMTYSLSQLELEYKWHDFLESE